MKQFAMKRKTGNNILQGLPSRKGRVIHCRRNGERREHAHASGRTHAGECTRAFDPFCLSWKIGEVWLLAFWHWSDLGRDCQIRVWIANVCVLYLRQGEIYEQAVIFWWERCPGRRLFQWLYDPFRWMMRDAPRASLLSLSHGRI